VAQEPGTEYVHVAMQVVNAEVIDRIAKQYQLREAHLLPQLTSALPDASVPLMGTHGTILGYIAWSPDRPGLALVRQASPAFVGFGLLAAGVLWFLLKRLRRATDALQQSQSEAQYLALHDTLTGLPNRALFEDRLRRALLAVARDDRKIGLLYIDLDRFKTVNDTFGHPSGDELVRQTAARLESSVRQVDTVARLGGDEFAVIIFDIKNLRTAEELCERLLGELGKPFDLMGNQVFVGASIGVAISHGSDTDPADLLRKADIALYEAKKNGRGRHQVFAGDMDDLLAQKRMIESDLREALTSGKDIRLSYQPVYAQDGQTVVGAEALIRWDHPVHGVLSPAHFVSIAEERGMTSLLGNWVLGETARFAATVDLPWIAFNVSPLQLRDTGYAAHVLGVLDAVGVSPSRIQIEIVESALLENSQTTRAVLSELRDAGIRIVLDDFGTGYSSINYLKRHIIDKLKIDRSFVRMLGSSEGSAIVKAIVELASALNVRVTAEGVETPEQRDLLVEMGCDELQGFLLSPPLDAREIQALGSAQQRETMRSVSGV
jgi:diguanylate cyclase (GGDEF)-like protein